MQIDLQGKVAVVTGASAGIGATVAGILADCGATVAASGLDEQQLEKAAAAIGDLCTPIIADASNREDMERLYKTVGDKFGRLDIVVANAGVGSNAPLGQITDEKSSTVIDTNLKGVLYTVQEAWPLLKPGASVIMIGSTASVDGPPGMSLYGASKAGLRSYTTTWVKDITGSGVRTNMLSPGATDTPSLRKALEAEKDEGKIKASRIRARSGGSASPRKSATWWRSSPATWRGDFCRWRDEGIMTDCP